MLFILFMSSNLMYKNFYNIYHRVKYMDKLFF